MTKATLIKAKRRIKRFVENGKSQARVRQIGENVFKYILSHRHNNKEEEHVTFKMDKIGRLKVVT